MMLCVFLIVDWLIFVLRTRGQFATSTLSPWNNSRIAASEGRNSQHLVKFSYFRNQANEILLSDFCRRGNVRSHISLCTATQWFQSASSYFCYLNGNKSPSLLTNFQKKGHRILLLLDLVLKILKDTRRWCDTCPQHNIENALCMGYWVEDA